mmetsp:Transcript_20127/g.60011  ORF Transcript_20127/g.60011 Transcript_20127/m.60011 type:complete len:1183 (+) Transcript_20127:244-3792(+)
MLVRRALRLRSTAVAPRALSAASDKYVLTINCGSSSIKFGAFRVGADGPVEHCSGVLEEVGSDASRLKLVAADVTRQEVNLAIPDHGAGLAKIRDALAPHVPSVAAVGHRVVHGGATILGPKIVTEEVLAEIEACSALAPLHNPANVLGITFARETWDAPHVAVPDTAFHAASMAPAAYRYALPKDLYEDFGVRRYGFHGTSYSYVTKKLAEALGKPVGSVNAILCHLGSGASMCVVENGKSMDTTMGLTPLEGLVMGTRAGDVDAGVLSFLARQGREAADVDALLNKRSGLLGLSNVGSDMRAVKAAAEAGDPDAKLARDVFVERVRKYLGAYAVKLGGRVDAVAFCGGIGEGDADARARILANLELLLGCEVDATKNGMAVDGGGVREISTAFSRTKAFVVPTDEEVEIATQTAQVTGVVVEEEVARPPPTPRVALPDADVAPLGSAVFVDGGGKTTPAELGLMFSALGAHENVGYFRTVADVCDEDAYVTDAARLASRRHDRKVTLMREVFGLDDVPRRDMFGVTRDEALRLLANNEEDELVEKVLTKYLAYAKGRDFVLVSRPVENVFSSGGRIELSAKLAEALGIPMVWVQGSDAASQFAGRHGGDALSPLELAELAQVRDLCKQHAVRMAGVVVAGLPQHSDRAALRAQLKGLGVEPAALLPHDEAFEGTTVAEVADALGATLAYGDAAAAHARRVDTVTIATLDVANLLSHIDSKPDNQQLIIVDSRRADVILSVLVAARLKTVAGLLLTGPGVEPEVDAILRDRSQRPGCAERIALPPVLTLSGKTTYEVAHAVTTTGAHMLPSSKLKVRAARTLFDDYLEPGFRRALGATATYGVLPPKVFQHRLFTDARQDRQHVVLPEGDDRRVVAAAGELLARGSCDLTILGDPKVVAAHAQQQLVDISAAKVIDPHDCDPELFDRLAESYLEQRKHKGVDITKARATVADDPNTFGVMLMKEGLADAMVSGARHSSANTMRPAIQILRTAPGFDIVSSVFFMLLQDGVKVFADCAINVSPNPDQLAQIAVASARTAAAFGVEPRVAMLSYATGDSNAGALIDSVREATEKAKALAPDVPIEGPLQFDAAVDPEVAAVKYKGTSEVPGAATVCIFPDLTSANNGYKAVQQATKSIAVGPVMQGLAKPVNDLSRGATVEDIVNTVVITCLQSIAAKNSPAE